MYTLDLSSDAFQMAAGTTYTLAMFGPNDAGYGWLANGNTANPANPFLYGGGGGYFGTSILPFSSLGGVDFGFRTYVNEVDAVPEPPALAVVGLALVALGVGRQRVRQTRAN